MKKYAHFNGKIIPEDEIKINFNDLGFARGYGVFDAMKTIGKKPFLLKEHYERLFNSAESLGLSLRVSQNKFAKIVEELFLRNGQEKDIFIKTILTGGVSSNGLRLDGEPTILIFTGDLAKVEPEKKFYQYGVGIVLVEFQRQLPEVKTLNYIVAVKNQFEKEKANAIEIVYHYNNFLLEGATGNIFIIKNNKVITPSENILPGTTRNFVLKILDRVNMETEVRNIKITELQEADEIFLTGTFKNILPVTEIAGKKIADGRVGEKTKEIMKLFENESRKVIQKQL